MTRDHQFHKSFLASLLTENSQLVLILFVAVTNIGIFKIWGKRNGPWVQALHCLFVVGMLLAPVISRPFLSDRDSDQHGLNQTAANRSNTSLPNVTAEIVSSDEVDLTHPYLIVGLLSLLSATVFAVTLLLTKQSGWRFFVLEEPSKASQNDSETNTRETDAWLRHRKMIFTALISMFIISYCMAEMLLGMFLVTFIVQYIGWSASDAAGLASVYFFAVIASRASGVFFITFIKPIFLIISGIVLLVLSCVLFYLVKEHWSIVWIASFSSAVGSATIFPSTLTWVSEYTEVKGYVGTALLVSTSVGYFAAPLLLGLLFSAFEISAFLYVLTVALCLNCALLLVTKVFLLLCWERGDQSKIEMDDVSANQRFVGKAEKSDMEDAGSG